MFGIELVKLIPGASYVSEEGTAMIYRERDKLPLVLVLGLILGIALSAAGFVAYRAWDDVNSKVESLKAEAAQQPTATQAGSSNRVAEAFVQPTDEPQDTPPSTLQIVSNQSSNDESCRVIDDYIFDGMESIGTTTGNYLHVSYWTTQTKDLARPELEVVLPAGTYRISNDTTVRGHVWEYDGCSRQEVENQVEDHIARRDESGGWGTDRYFQRISS